MINRRALLISGLVSSVAVRTQKASAAAAESAKSWIEWLWQVTKDGIPSVEQIYDYLLRVKNSYKLLTNSRARLRDIRRRLTDPSSERHLQTKLAEWLKHYDAWASQTPRAGEPEPEFSARKERERLALQEEWQRCKSEALLALKAIEYLGNELQSIDAKAMPSEEFRAYRNLLEDEKEVAEALIAEMPTDPYVIDKLREVAKNLDQIVSIIDKRAAELDDAVKRAG